MSKKKQKKSNLAGFREFVEKHIPKIQGATKTLEYKITYAVKDRDEKFIENGTEYHTHASVDVDDRYLSIKLTFYPIILKEFKDKNYTWIKEVLTHEMAHVKTHPLRKLSFNRHVTEEQINHEDERLTEFLGRVIYDKLYK